MACSPVMKWMPQLWMGFMGMTSRLLKNTHLSRASRDYPAASPSRRRGKKSLLIRRDAFRPAHRLTGVPRVAPYSSQRHPLILPRVKTRGRLVAAYVVGNGLKPFPTKDFGLPRKRDFADSTCIWAFLSSLTKITFSASC